MYYLLIGLIIIAALLLCVVVMIQNSKGGGLASSFASSNQIMGVRKTTDFLEKTTWTLIGIIVVLCVLATAFHKTDAPTTTSEIADQVELPVQAPAGFDDAAVELPTEVATEEETEEG